VHECAAWRGKEAAQARIDHELIPRAGQQGVHSIVVRLTGQNWSAEADDAFAALCEIRCDLEREGWMLAIEGSRVRSYPSGMQRDQGGGLWVYRLEPGAPAGRDSQRSIFDPVDVSECGTVAEQLAYFTRSF
jgi:hypothetical protein